METIKSQLTEEELKKFKKLVFGKSAKGPGPDGDRESKHKVSQKFSLSF